MKVVISSVILAALLGLANAKVQFTNSNFDDIEAGQTFEITWSEAEGPVTVTLKNGSDDDLKTVQTLTTGATGDSFVWSVDPSLVTGNYALEISDGTDVNYSAMFPVSGTTAPSSTGASSGTASATRSTVSLTSSAATSTSSSSATSSETSSSEATSSETTSSESSTATTSSAATTSSSASTSASSTTVTRTTSSTPSSTQSNPAQTSVPNTNDAGSMAAPLVPGLLALIGAALI